MTLATHTDTVLSGDDVPPTKRDQQSRQAAVAGSIGNILEWYDFAVYGFMAAIIAKQFFPTGDANAALLLTFTVFGIGFLARPLGGFLIGRLADKKGRKPALLVTMMVMAIGTLMIGVIPNYATIGIAAPVMLVVARLLQGFSAGGEWGTAAGFMVEWAPTGKRGLFGSFQQMTAMAGLVLGSGVAALFSTLLTPVAMEDWGWRVPFIIGFVIGPFGLYLRRTIAETPAFEKHAQVMGPVDSEWGPSVRLFALVATPYAVAFTFLSYLPTFTQKYVGLSRAEALWANTLSLVVAMVFVPMCGALSDRVGRRPMLITANLGFLLLSYPMLAGILAYPNVATVLVVQIVFGILYAMYAGPGSATYVELFPTKTRMTWLSSSYNLAGIVFGAFAGSIATWLISSTGSPVAVVYFVIAATLISGIGMFGMRETAHLPLR